MANEGDILKSVSGNFSPEITDFERGDRIEDGRDVRRSTISISPIGFEALRRPIFSPGRDAQRAPGFIGRFDEALQFFDPLAVAGATLDPAAGATSLGGAGVPREGGDVRLPLPFPQRESAIPTIGEPETAIGGLGEPETAISTRGEPEGAISTTGEPQGAISTRGEPETAISTRGEPETAISTRGEPEGAMGGGPTGGQGSEPGEGGAGSTGGGGDCIVTTALNDMGAWTDSEKRVAVDWCRRTHHDGSSRGRAWVRGYHVWGAIVAKMARRWPLFRRFVRYTTSRFVDHTTGRDRNAVGFAVHALIVTPFSYVIGVLRNDKHPRI